MGGQLGVEVWDCWVGVGEVEEGGDVIVMVVVRALQVREVGEEEGYGEVGVVGLVGEGVYVRVVVTV
jgi:hypothetical protein